MSWASEPTLAEELGARHAHFDAAALYEATVAPDSILAYLERRDEEVGESGPAVVLRRDPVHRQQPPRPQLQAGLLLDFTGTA